MKNFSIIFIIVLLFFAGVIDYPKTFDVLNARKYWLDRDTLYLDHLVLDEADSGKYAYNWGDSVTWGEIDTTFFATTTALEDTASQLRSEIGSIDTTGIYHDNRDALDLVSGINTGDGIDSLYFSDSWLKNSDTIYISNYWTEGTYGIYTDENIGIGTVASSSRKLHILAEGVTPLALNRAAGDGMSYYIKFESNGVMSSYVNENYHAWFAGGLSVHESYPRVVIDSDENSYFNTISIDATEIIDNDMNATFATITADSIYTTKAGGWADKVFAKNYELSSIEDELKHIKTNKHLRSLPSEADRNKYFKKGYKKTSKKDSISVTRISLQQMQNEQVSILEETEKQYLYIGQLLDKINDLEKRLSKIEGKK